MCLLWNSLRLSYSQELVLNVNKIVVKVSSIQKCNKSKIHFLSQNTYGTELSFSGGIYPSKNKMNIFVKVEINSCF